jgi:HlyD family secretion protein
MKRMNVIRFSVFTAMLILAGCGNDETDSIEASGTLEAVEVNIASRTSGQLLKLAVREGDMVNAGDTIAVIDHALLDLQLQQATAGVDLAAAQYDLLRNGARKEDIRSAEETVRQTESSHASARMDFDRIRELFATHAVSKKQYDDAESRFTITLAQYNAAQQNLQKLRHFARPEEIAAAKARVDQASAQANLFRKHISDSYIVAPVNGTVTYKPAEAGELINPGTVIVRLSQLERMELMIYVKETELGKVKLGANADVMIDTYPEKRYPATVVYVSPVAEFTPRNVQTKDERTKLVFGVKLVVDNSNGELKSGMPADAVVR